MMQAILRVLSLLVLAVGISAAWLFRDDLLRVAPPEVQRVGDALGAGGGRDRSADRATEAPGKPVAPGERALERARDKVDSLHGWDADSVVLSPAEVASLIMSGLPPAARARLDSVRVRLGDSRLTVDARLETTAIPAQTLGPLAGALEPWEPVTGSGLIAATKPGWAEWRVDALTLRGFTLPATTSRELISRALPGVRNGALPFPLPKGIARVRVHPAGAVLYREGR
jgi:hypothetical protein